MPRKDDFRWVEDDPDKRGFEYLYSDKINRLGLGPEILRLRKLGYSGSKIAEILGLNPDTTRRWIRNFNALTATQKKEYIKVMQENSVFNLKDQLDKLYSQAEDMKSMLQNNPEQYGKYLDIQTKQLKLAADIVEKVERLNTQRKTVEIILQCIARVAPELRAEIMKELNSVKELRGLIT